MDDRVGWRLREQHHGLIAHHDAELAAQTEYFAQIFAGQFGITIHRADQLQSRPVENQTGRRAPDGTQSILNDTNRFAHENHSLRVL